MFTSKGSGLLDILGLNTPQNRMENALWNAFRLHQPILRVLFDLGTPIDPLFFRYFADYIIESTHFYLYIHMDNL